MRSFVPRRVATCPESWSCRRRLPCALGCGVFGQKEALVPTWMVVHEGTAGRGEGDRTMCYRTAPARRGTATSAGRAPTCPLWPHRGADRLDEWVLPTAGRWETFQQGTPCTEVCGRGTVAAMREQPGGIGVWGEKQCRASLPALAQLWSAGSSRHHGPRRPSGGLRCGLASQAIWNLHLSSRSSLSRRAGNRACISDPRDPP